MPVQESKENQSELPSSLSKEDKSSLDIAALKKQLAEKEAENANLNYRYLVLQLFQKYQLTAKDAVDADGNFHRNVNQ